MASREGIGKRAGRGSRRRALRRGGLAGLALLPLVGAGAARADDFFLERVATGLSRPVFATAPPGDTTRLFLVEQFSGSTGRVRILRLATGELLATPFLAISGVSTGGEQGLLGLAFHPDYASNGHFFVNFTDATGRTIVRRYSAGGDPDLADPASAWPVLEIAQPQGNHNGGWLGFGPDGFLYVATGDGGGSDDNDAGHTPDTGNSQDTSDNLLGKVLRIDVDGDDFPLDPDRNYAIPADNPFVGAAGDDEIWLYGLRNPWRLSFDRETGDLYIGDVGQGSREEIDVQPAGSPGGTNFGWRLREGTIATPTGGVGGPRPPGAVDPIYDYTHGAGPTQGQAVTGGVVYRGPVPSLRGRYLFADYATSRIWSLRWDGSDPADFDGTNFTEFIDWGDSPAFQPDQGTLDEISSFGEDAQGHLYVVSLQGDVFRVSPLAPPVPGLGRAPLALLVAALAACGGRLALRRRRGRAAGAPPGP